MFDPSAGTVILATAPGSKFHALGHARTAAFEIDEIDEAARTGWSVILRGITEEVTRPYELRQTERLGLDPWAPGEKPHLLRIRANRVSGRRIVP